MKKYTIYILFNPISQSYFYIGQTANPFKRLIDHRRACKIDILMLPIQVIYGSKKQAIKVEKHWIQYLSKHLRLTNLCATSTSKSYKRNKR